MMCVVFYLISLTVFGLLSYKAIHKKPYTVRYWCISKHACVIQIFFNICQKLIPFLSSRVPHIVKNAFAHEKVFCVIHFAKINSWNYKHGRQDSPQVIQFTGWHKKKRELSKNPTKIEEIQEKKFIDRNWTITTCLLRDSNPKYQCLSRILQSMQHTQGDTKERELLKCLVAVKECIRGGGRHLQDVIFKHW